VDASGSAATHYAALRRATRPHRWLMAITVGAAVGVFTNLVLPGPLPLLAAVLTTAALLIWDHNRGTIAGWWPVPLPPTRLAALATRLERHGWTAIPHPRDTDRPIATYLLIGPGGVFVIDHQTWSALHQVTTHRATGLLMVSGVPAARRVAAVKGAAAAVTHALTENLPDDSAVHAVVTVDGLTLDRARRVADVTLVPVTDLTTFVHEHGRLLTPTQVAALSAQAQQRYHTG